MYEKLGGGGICGTRKSDKHRSPPLFHTQTQKSSVCGAAWNSYASGVIWTKLHLLLLWSAVGDSQTARMLTEVALCSPDTWLLALISVRYFVIFVAKYGQNTEHYIHSESHVWHLKIYFNFYCHRINHRLTFCEMIAVL
jgi:hypothetical protein